MKFLIQLSLSTLFVFLIACSSEPTSTEKIGSIEGFVFDGSTGFPLNKARVITTPPTFSVTTDTLGNYQITNVDPGTYRVNAAKFGYDSTGVNISVSAGIITTADIPLISDSIDVAMP